jgi:hypothetical protein
MVRGAVAGGAVLGLAGAALGGGLCDAADCSGSGSEGFFVGALVGLVGGGITGLVAGSALRAPELEGSRASPGYPWSWSVGVGGGWAGAGELEGWRIVASGALDRPTVRRVHFGIEARYLGTTSTDQERHITTPLATFVDREHTTWNVFGLVMTARFDDVGNEAGAGGFLTVSSGVYPIWKARQVDRSGDVPQGTPAGHFVDESEILPLPGVGAGVGYAWGRPGTRTMDVQARLDGILGAGDRAILPVFGLTGGMRFR